MFFFHLAPVVFLDNSVQNDSFIESYLKLSFAIRLLSGLTVSTCYIDLAEALIESFLTISRKFLIINHSLLITML